MKRYIAVGACLIAGICLQAVSATDAPDTGMTRAELIAQSCANCHGTEGRLRTAIPAIAGVPEVVLRAQLLAFKRDQMPGATVMPRLVKGFTDRELEALAGYFSRLSAREER